MFFKVSSPVLCHFGAWHNSVLSSQPGSCPGELAASLANEKGVRWHGILGNQKGGWPSPPSQNSVLDGVLPKQKGVPASQNYVLGGRNCVPANRNGVLGGLKDAPASQNGLWPARMAVW